MIGIRFEIPNEYGQFLKKILENVKIKNGFWKIVTDDIIKKNGDYLFNEEVYNNIDFQKIISSNEYYLTFADIQYYNENQFFEIYDFESFLKSDCGLLIIVVDNIFVDIYSKSKVIIKHIENNAIKYKFKNITIINNKLDKRNTFYI